MYILLSIEEGDRGVYTPQSLRLTEELNQYTKITYSIHTERETSVSFNEVLI